MNTTQKLFFYFFIFFALTSCNSVLLYHMDVLRPGYVVAQADQNSVLLVDNAGLQPPRFGHFITDNLVDKQDTAFNTGMFSKYLLESVAKYLSQEAFYENIEISEKSDSNFMKGQNGNFLRSSRLSGAQVKILGDSGKFDLLFSLDRLIIRSETKVHPYYDVYRATRDVSVSAVWRIFDANADTLITQFQYMDSLYWERYSYTSGMALQTLPGLEESLPEIGDVVAEHVSKLLGAYWESVERPYFCTGSFRMQYAADCIRNNDWEGAAAWWSAEFDKGFGRSVYRAAMNMMLYHEYTGDLNEALLWSNKAENALNRFPFGVPTFDSDLLKKWSETLRMRSLENEKLKKYFIGRFEYGSQKVPI